MATVRPPASSSRGSAVSPIAQDASAGGAATVPGPSTSTPGTVSGERRGNLPPAPGRALGARQRGGDMPDANAMPTLRLGDTEVLRIGLGTNRLTDTPGHVAFVKEAVG